MLNKLKRGSFLKFALFMLTASIWSLSGSAANAATAISNCTGLQNISQNLAESYYLTSDIDCSETTTWNGGQGFAPIINFSGELDGRGYTISNLFVNGYDLNVGLFGYIRSSRIHDLNLSSFNLSTYDRSVQQANPIVDSNGGALAGYAFDSIISNINVYNLSLMGNNSGGIVGLSNNSVIASSKVSYTSGTGSISGNEGGGLVGSMTATLIIDSYYETPGNDTPAVTRIGGNHAGAIAGRVISGRIINCYGNGAGLKGNYLGGLVGLIDSNGEIRNSFSKRVAFLNDDKVTGEVQKGCLIGANYGANLIRLSVASEDNCSAAIGNNPNFSQSDVTSVSLSAVSPSSFPVTDWDFGSVWSIVACNPALINGQLLRYCGDSRKNLAFEQCDGADLAGATCPSGYSGTVRCNGSCQLDTSACQAVSFCGNGRIDSGEACDGAQLNNQTCVTKGFSYGTFRCSADCKSFDTSACITGSTPPVEVSPTCTDSDAGGNVTVKGYIHGNYMDGTSYIKYDECVDNNNVREWTCGILPFMFQAPPKITFTNSDGSVTTQNPGSVTTNVDNRSYLISNIMPCLNGCYDGACKVSSGQSCSDTDGDNKYTKGRINYGSLYINDNCYDSRTVTEYYCASPTATIYSSKNYTCENGCLDGACVQAVATSPNICIDSDGGKNYSLKGKTYFQNSAGQMMAGTQVEDYCHDGNILEEHSCGVGASGGNSIFRESAVCLYGCADGTCKSATSAKCGNGIVESGEQCDGNPPFSCLVKGLKGGQTKCTNCQIDFSGCYDPSAVSVKPSSVTTKPATTPAKPKNVYNYQSEANLIAQSGDNRKSLLALIANSKTGKRQSSGEQKKMWTKCTQPLLKDFDSIPMTAAYDINNFVYYGTLSTAKLTATQRCQLVRAYADNLGLPENADDWKIILSSQEEGRVLGEKIFDFWNSIRPIGSIF